MYFLCEVSHSEDCSSPKKKVNYLESEISSSVKSEASYVFASYCVTIFQKRCRTSSHLKILHKKKFRLICQNDYLMLTLNFLFHFKIALVRVWFAWNARGLFLFRAFYIFLPVCKWDSFREYPDILICKMSTKCQIALWNRRSTFYMCLIYDKWGFHLCIGCKWPNAKAGNTASFLFIPFPKNASNLKVK